ncbi:MAG TPA: DUF3551 domain-containing protein [Bradyrhizobium sp.]|nr:DUF3551 domain-containing protein [Bradyrhizobium sp.]
MRTILLSLVTSAIIFTTGVTSAAAGSYAYCIHGDEYAATGDCSFATYAQCQAAASGLAAYCEANGYLDARAHLIDASSLALSSELKASARHARH